MGFHKTKRFLPIHERNRHQSKGLAYRAGDPHLAENKYPENTRNKVLPKSFAQARYVREKKDLCKF